MDRKRIDVQLEIKEVDSDGTFSGYGSVFGVQDAYREIVMPGAFKRSLREWKKKAGGFPKLLYQHRSDQVIGKYTAMREDEHGLYLEGKLFKDDIQLAKEAHFLLKEEAITGLSIGFVTRRHEWDSTKKIRKLLDVDLWEVSLVTFPANTSAQVVGVKAADEINNVREYEQFLINEGWSRSAAKALASKGYDALSNLREVEDDDDTRDLREADTLNQESIRRAINVLTS